MLAQEAIEGVGPVACDLFEKVATGLRSNKRLIRVRVDNVPAAARGDAQRGRKKSRQSVRPEELIATGPNQVWS